MFNNKFEKIAENDVCEFGHFGMSKSITEHLSHLKDGHFCLVSKNKKTEDMDYIVFDKNQNIIKDDKSAEAWGRLASLSYLTGHIGKEALFDDLSIRNENSFVGMMDVFTTNLSNPKHKRECIEGLTILLHIARDKAVFSKFNFSLKKADFTKLIPMVVIELFLKNSPLKYIRDINGAFKWFKIHVSSMPDAVLIQLEVIIERFNQIQGQSYFSGIDGLIVTLRLLLQEADLTDDVEYINRVIAVQDWFIENGAGIEQLLET